MRIRYLGTAAGEGIPAPYCQCAICQNARKTRGPDVRTRSQAIVDDAILIDLPPENSAHALEYGIDLLNITTTLITHDHSDHFYADELEMRCPPFSGNDSAPPVLELYGSKACEDHYNAIVPRHPEMARYNRFNVVEPLDTIQREGYTITVLRAAHAKDQTCLFYMLEKEGKRLLYAHDTGYFPEDAWQAVAGKHFDLVSLDCTHQRDKEGSNHMGLEDTVEVKARLLEMGCADENTIFVVNHFSHNGGWDHATMQRKAAAHGMLTSFDGMVVEF